MDPARSLQDRTGVVTWVVEPTVTAIGIGLEDSAIAGQMRLRMFTGTIA
jgi:hypothetical protein